MAGAIVRRSVGTYPSARPPFRHFWHPPVITPGCWVTFRAAELLYYTLMCECHTSGSGSQEAATKSVIMRGDIYRAFGVSISPNPSQVSVHFIVV